MLRFANHLSNQVFKEILICGGIDHRTSQRFRGTKSYAVKAQYRHAQCTTDISTFLSPNSEERIRGDRRGTSNKRMCSRDIERQQRKESVVSNRILRQSISSCEVRKVS